MNEREFCYWLQGLFEISDVKSLDERQVSVIKDHLALVFKKVTPDRSVNLPFVPPTNYPPGTIPFDQRQDIWRPYQGATCSISGQPDTKSIVLC